MDPNPEILSTAERNGIQAELIKQFCEIAGMEDEEKQNICAGDWIAKFADNFPQLDADLIERFRTSDGEEKKVVLKEIQAKLEELDKIYG